MDKTGSKCADVAACYGNCPLINGTVCEDACKKKYPFGSTVWLMLQACVGKNGKGCSCS